MRKSALPTWVFHFAKKGEPEPVPEDLSAVEESALAGFEESLSAEFDALYNVEGQPTPEALARMEQIAGDIERVRSEMSTRNEAAEANRRQADEIAARIRPAGEAPTPAEATPEGAVEAEAAQVAEPVAAAVEGVTALSVDVVPSEASIEGLAALGEAIGTKVAEAVVASITASGPQTIPAEDSISRRPKLNEVRRRAPNPELAERATLSIVAAADIPGYSAGSSISSLNEIAMAAHRKARSLQNHSGYVPIASIEREFSHSLNEDSQPQEVRDAIRELTDPASLLAAGGWCAPSEIRYELFNIACEDGEIDLPTVGITRGGMRWPTSPALADVLSEVWTWSETDDILAVTGDGTKPCVRIPCVDFSEARLGCFGLCVTSGNLSDKAYPENNENFISLVMSAHFHAINKSIIDQVVAFGTGVTMTASSGSGATSTILEAIDLQAIDYRQKYGMCLDDILEVKLPNWAKGIVRSDMARKRGVDANAVSNEEIGTWLDRRGVSAQWLNDYQVGTGAFPGQATARTTWPGTLNFLIYAAGTVVRGSGPTIDLGVVRDSTLNATNDFTAAWTEECNLVAQVGHEVRNVAVDVCADGATGGDNDYTCA